MIEVKNLSCSFSEGAFTKNKFTAVSPISAIFKNGGRYAIVGESGSGKTTLARMIASLQRPDNGNVLFYALGLLLYCWLEGILLLPVLLLFQCLFYISFLPEEFTTHLQVVLCLWQKYFLHW